MTTAIDSRLQTCPISSFPLFLLQHVADQFIPYLQTCRSPLLACNTLQDQFNILARLKFGSPRLRIYSSRLDLHQIKTDFNGPTQTQDCLLRLVMGRKPTRHRPLPATAKYNPRLHRKEAAENKRNMSIRFRCSCSSLTPATPTPTEHTNRFSSTSSCFRTPFPLPPTSFLARFWPGTAQPRPETILQSPSSF
jgi:hypothetical protein